MITAIAHLAALPPTPEHSQPTQHSDSEEEGEQCGRCAELNNSWTAHETHQKNAWKEQYGRVIEELKRSRREVKELKLQLKEAARVTRQQTLEKANEPEPFDQLVNVRVEEWARKELC